MRLIFRMLDFPSSPRQLAYTTWHHRALISTLIRREVAGRYKGSVLGVLWSFVLPVMMLAVYTFIFSVVFQARWSAGSQSRTEFALILFAGLLVFNLFAECINRAPGLVVSNTNYVKKVVFPLDILPVVVLGSAVFHFLVGLLVWLVFYLAMFGMVSVTALLLPLVVVPLMLLTLGLSWFLAATGVYLRDLAQVTSVVVSTLLFMSPVFFPVSALPEPYRSWLMLNPLSPAIEMTRDVLIWQKAPDWSLLAFYYVFSLAVAWAGFAWFQKTRKGFADVL